MIAQMFHEVSLRGIAAVWRRHARIYARTIFSNCIPPISEPIIYLVGFGLGLGPMLGGVYFNNAKVGFLEFLAPGMIAVGCLMQAFFEGVYGTYVRFKYLRIWQAMLSAPLSFGDVFLGDLAWAASKGILASIATGVVAICWGILSFHSLVLFMPLVIVAAVGFAALGMLSAGLIRTIDEVNIPTFLVVVPMPIFCGGYFPRASLPQWVEMFFQYLPFALLVDQMRLIEFADNSGVLMCCVLLVAWTAVLVLCAASALFKKIIR